MSVLPFCYVVISVQEQGCFFDMQISDLKLVGLHAERGGDSESVLIFALDPQKAEIFAGEFML